jgi:RHS repeat-associated protein
MIRGEYFDKETNLHYNYFRDYDPAIGRYIQSDPIGLDGGLNTYLYVLADPLSLFDAP